MDRGPAGPRGHLVHLGAGRAQDPATILHPMGAEHPAWAPPLKLATALDEEHLPQKKSHKSCSKKNKTICVDDCVNYLLLRYEEM